MKKIIMVLVCGVLYTSLTTSPANAQKASDIAFADATVAKKSSLAEAEKKVAANAVSPEDETSKKEKKANLRAAKANLKVTNHFNKNFKDVSDLTWSDEEKATVATFKINEKSARIVYDKRGNWLYSIINYQEDQMPANIRSLVKSAYKGFSISLVQEVSQNDITLYKIHLEDCNSLKQILVYNDEITVYEDYTKSK